MSPISLHEWRTEAQRSLLASQERRVSPHPWPRGSEWRTVAALLVIVAVAAAGAILLWASM